MFITQILSMHNQNIIISFKQLHPVKTFVVGLAAPGLNMLQIPENKQLKKSILIHKRSQKINYV